MAGCVKGQSDTTRLSAACLTFQTPIEEVDNYFYWLKHDKSMHVRWRNGLTPYKMIINPTPRGIRQHEKRQRG